MRLSITTIVYAVALVTIAGCMTSRRVQRAAKMEQSALPSLPPGMVALAVARAGKNVIVSWQNNSNSVDQLQTRTSHDGDWVNVAGGVSSPITITANLAMAFFRLVRDAPPGPTNVIVHFNGQTPNVWRITWENTCSNCDMTISRSGTARDWVQIGQVAAMATNFTDNAAPWPGTNYYRVRAVKKGVSDL